ncbi:MAG: hypothetical protein GPOALKHO_000358 [Sodalis sp.]|uniref:hypothetical protein n=1 Tax=Sodalis sp. (in: enterobacteria) TaxID=1898979 RepID=UPI003872C22D|nr:MAG: hypothetical protein GPOALKHO_000358 [Sodalis sp.]
MYGTPLISCEIGTGTTYVNIHRQTGQQNPIQARRYGEQALERFNALFTSRRMVSSYADIYRELAGHDRE